MNHIFELSDSKREAKVSELGGKGASLVKLTQGGFRVPEGFVVMSSGFDEYAQSCDLIHSAETQPGTIDDKRNMILSLFAKTPVQKGLKESIQVMLDKINQNPSLPTPLLAVRSSGVTEDLDEASFAGMNDTILNVPTEVDAVCEAIKKCWLSLYGKRSIVYRQENGFPAYNTSIAVVVQVMIPSEASGVVFTADPHTSSRGQISLDGVQGLGEALVSGMVDTDHWLIRKPYQKRKMFIEDTHIGQQQFKLVSNYPLPGTKKVELTEEEGLKKAFTNEQVFSICETACGIERYYMKPMDIEFCYYKDTMYIVQARPITKLHVIPDRLNPLLNENQAIWSCWISFNAIQMITKTLTPGAASFFRSFIGVSEKYIMQVSGYMYINVTAILHYSFIRNKFLPLIAGNINKEIGCSSIELYKNDYKYYKHTDKKEPMKILFNRLIKNALKSVIRSKVKGIPAQELKNKFEDAFNNVYQKLKSDITKDLEVDINESREIFLELLPHFVPCIIFGLLNQGKIRKILKKYDLKDINVENLWGNRPENMASRMNHCVMKMGILLKKILAQDAKLASEIQAVADSKDNAKWLDLLTTFSSSTVPELKEFAKLWHSFMDSFGQRGPAEIDIAVPRYCERPTLVLNMLLNIDSSDYKTEEEGVKEREDVTRTVLSLLSKKDRKKVEKCLPYAQLMLCFREHPKYLIVTTIHKYRNYLLQEAKTMVQKNIIEQEDDIFFIPLETLYGYLRGTDNGSSFKNVVRENRATDALGQTLEFPRAIMGPECIMKTISDTTREELKHLPPNMMKGLPTSPGVFEGVAVVCTDPETAVIKKGEILVAQATDPGWTPLFVPAGAAVIEVGGTLTHGSVVAREMGIPCVVSIQNLMTRVKTGMRLRVDGSKGVVEILE